ncbi:symmetrical bis(5'-nucleosyl)-tetraphosphatase [Thioalkalivibrio paradoxus]|uniref:Bis(5'-nucleosyl)-tetraphosphatase, symmetrical n=1 Tax=Thioalkalivibrio paradoxus ARh 1 TaxID=713585 RepID=W0DLP9_9GAMM|nr:symmetrical bis(5'-nucleosyl)-tetraphosphatase [Thioalkalivibrio paradoxus]AHE97923.1 diadenosine tetraphosphatase [Thioalkalivibrio paradoxus ARh 1]
MAVYAVGDLQGCLDPLERLLERVAFDPQRDRLWLVGDLVNRGPDSGACLKRVRDLGDAAVTVLGNHDLHLLAAGAGLRTPRPRDTLDDVLDRPDADELLEWVAHRPLLHHDASLDWTLVHAGIPPQWDLERAQAEARAVEEVLAHPDQREAFLAQMYGNHPDRWSARLRGVDRLRYTVNAFTRMRYIRDDGGLDFDDSGPPGLAPPWLTPWFDVPGRACAGQRIVFGHWSALGHRRGPDWLALDSGCVWGNQLTMVRLDAAPDDEALWQQPCPG